jgi:competence protein ComEC
VIRVTYGDTSFLFTGDSQATAHAALAELAVKANVLKVPHHGSRTTSADFFESVAPSLAVISAGTDNPFGHPHPDALAALGDTPVFRTDLHGRITVRSDGERIRVTSER